MTTASLEARTIAPIDRKRHVTLAVPALILAYLIYAAIRFDLAGLAQRARLDNAAVLLADAVSHKIHVTRDNRRETLSVSVQGSARATYPEDRIPDWIAAADGCVTIDLGGGHLVTYDGPVTTYDFPGYGPVVVTVGDEVTLTTADGITPDFINSSPSRITITTNAGRVTATPARRRGVIALIFTIILSRAFGPGPQTGALAILLTDAGSFGKLLSAALVDVDKKSIEGIQSTGANAIQQYRFGVIPQVMPVLISQVLYFMESNTRSATIIGAITGGGIGLVLTQAIQTIQDWER